MKSELAKKDVLIKHLIEEVSDLKLKVKTLENKLDEVDQYERRDTIIISGVALPDESTHKNSKSVILILVKDQLKSTFKTVISI